MREYNDLMNKWGKRAIKVIREDRVELGRGFVLGRLSACHAENLCQLM